MRRDPAADNGLIELMVAALAERPPRLGVEPVSLNFAVFREAFERGAEDRRRPDRSRLWRRLLLFATRNWQLESLYRSNAKYQPELAAPLHLLRVRLDLPRVGIAAGSAEGFLTGRPSCAADRREAAARGASTAPARATPRRCRPDPAAPGRRGRGRRRARGCPSRCGSGAPRSTGCAPHGIDPYPVGYPRTHTLAAVARRARRAAARTPGPATRSPSPAGSCSSATSAGSASPTLRDGPATCR